MEIREQLPTRTEARNLEQTGFSSEEIARLYKVKALYQQGGYYETTPEYKRLAFERWPCSPTWRWKVECTRAKPCPNRSGQNWMPSTGAQPYGSYSVSPQDIISPCKSAPESRGMRKRGRETRKDGHNPTDAVEAAAAQDSWSHLAF